MDVSTSRPVVRPRRLILALFLACLGAVPAFAGGMYLYEVGTPDVATAGAGYAARAEDAGTAFTNPAGMARLARPEILAGVQPMYLTTKFDPGDGTTTSGGGGGNAGGFIPAGGLYGVIPLGDRFAAGLAFNSYAGLAIEYDDDWAGRYYVQRSAILTYNLNPAASVRLTDWLSVGAGLNLIWADFETRAAINNVLDIQSDGELKFQDDDFGVGGTFGLLVEPSDWFRVGLTYRLPVDLDFSDTADIDGEGPILAAALNSQRLRDRKTDLSMTLPQEAMLSVVVRPAPALDLMADLGWQDWSEFGKVGVELDAANSRSLTVDRNYQDTWHVACGARYAVSPQWKVSAGFAYDSSAVSDADRTPDFPVDRVFRYAAGVSWTVDPDMELALSYEYADLGPARIDQERGPLTGRLEGDYKTNDIHTVVLNLSWSF